MALDALSFVDVRIIAYNENPDNNTSCTVSPIPPPPPRTSTIIQPPFPSPVKQEHMRNARWSGRVRTQGSMCTFPSPAFQVDSNGLHITSLIRPPPLSTSPLPVLR